MANTNDNDLPNVPHHDNQPFQNQGTNIHCIPQITWEPTTLKEIKQVVKKAKELGKKIRVVGDAHSWSPLWFRGKSKDAWLVKVGKIKHTNYFERDGKHYVTVGAGVTVGELVKEELKSRFNLPSNVIVAEATLAGVVSTGSHGTGLNQPLVSDLVESITMVLADGTLKKFSGHDGELFEAAKLSLGLFGIIYEKVEPIKVVRVKDSKPHLVDVFDRKNPEKLKKLITENEYVEISWFPLNYQEQIWVKTFNTAEGHEPDNKPCREWELNLQGFFAAAFSKFIDLVENKDPKITPLFSSQLTAFLDTQDTHQDLPYAIHYQTNLDNFPPTNDSEVAIKIDEDYANVVDAFLSIVEKTKEQQKRGKYPLNLVLGAKFIGRSTALLAPNYSKDPAAKWAFIEVESYTSCTDFNKFASSCFVPWMADKSWESKPHWGKNWQILNKVGRKFSIDAYLREAYGENFAKFSKYREQLDPTNMFLNDKLESVFYGEDLEELKSMEENFQHKIEDTQRRLDEIARKKQALHS